jgi:hypothetical protein
VVGYARLPTRTKPVGSGPAPAGFRLRGEAGAGAEGAFRRRFPGFRPAHDGAALRRRLDRPTVLHALAVTRLTAVLLLPIGVEVTWGGLEPLVLSLSA